ncbi:hypothetical protein V1523DRAFT_422042 [Lipomyces doorenjongii]
MDIYLLFGVFFIFAFWVRPTSCDQQLLAKHRRMYESMAYDRNLTLDALPTEVMVYDNGTYNYDFTTSTALTLRRRDLTNGDIIAIYGLTAVCVGGLFVNLRNAMLDCGSYQYGSDRACVVDAFGSAVFGIGTVGSGTKATIAAIGRWRNGQKMKRSAHFNVGKFFNTYDVKVSVCSVDNSQWMTPYTNADAAYTFAGQMYDYVTANSACTAMLVDWYVGGEKIMLTRWEGGIITDFSYQAC